MPKYYQQINLKRGPSLNEGERERENRRTALELIFEEGGTASFRDTQCWGRELKVDVF
jgi:hypothetical protein